MIKNIIYFFDSRKHIIGNYHGSETEKDFLMVAAYSLLCSKHLRTLHPLNIILITDQRGIEILSKIKFMFNEIRIITINDNTKYELFNQNESFIFIKFDVIPQSEMPLTLYNSEILLQDIKEDSIHSWNKNFIDNFKHFKNEIKYSDDVFNEIKSVIGYDKKITTINTGILGGNNISLLKKYSESILDFKIKNKLDSSFDRFLETIYSYYFFEINNAKIETVIPKIDVRKKILSLTERMVYIQLSDRSKKNKITLASIENILKLHYPNTYSKL